MGTPKKAVIYARFSCSKQREASIDDQIRECEQWCEREGYEVVACYKDEAMSGKTDDRPAFQQMIANAGESDIVLVYMMDRFSRDIYDAPIYKKQLRDKGVKVVSATEALPDGPEAMLMENMYEAFAAMESAKTSMRTKRGMEGNALMCKHNGVSVYGYAFAEDDTYCIDEGQAAFVKEAFFRKDQLESVNSIAADFASRGVRTYTGKPCSYTMVYHMLINEKYTGVYKFGDVRIEGGMPRIVSDALFYNVQEKLGRRSLEVQGHDIGRYLLAGKTICGSCAHNMNGASGRGRGNKKYEYYKCVECDARAIRREALERSVTDGLRDFLSHDENVATLARIIVGAAECHDYDVDRANAEKSLREAQKSLDNISAAIEQGVIPPNANQRIEELNTQIKQANQTLQAEPKCLVTCEDMADFLRGGTNMTDEQLLTTFIYQVLVRDDDALVTLNFDLETGEPARFEVGLVRRECDWLPIGSIGRTKIACIGSRVILKLPLDRKAA